MRPLTGMLLRMNARTTCDDRETINQIINDLLFNSYLSFHFIAPIGKDDRGRYAFSKTEVSTKFSDHFATVEGRVAIKRPYDTEHIFGHKVIFSESGHVPDSTTAIHLAIKQSDKVSFLKRE